LISPVALTSFLSAALARMKNSSPPVRRRFGRGKIAGEGEAGAKREQQRNQGHQRREPELGIVAPAGRLKQAQASIAGG
jgi:hypothetical protein